VARALAGQNDRKLVEEEREMGMGKPGMNPPVLLGSVLYVLLVIMMGRLVSLWLF